MYRLKDFTDCNAEYVFNLQLYMFHFEKKIVFVSTT